VLCRTWYEGDVCDCGGDSDDDDYGDSDDNDASDGSADDGDIDDDKDDDSDVDDDGDGHKVPTLLQYLTILVRSGATRRRGLRWYVRGPECRHGHHVNDRHQRHFTRGWWRCASNGHGVEHYNTPPSVFLEEFDRLVVLNAMPFTSIF
jgi:hypothetical protein